MKLVEQLRTQRRIAESERTPEQIRTMEEAAVKLLQSGIEEQALREGDVVPRFTLPNVHGKELDSKELFGKGWAVLTFYRGSWCPYCNLELRAYQQNIARIASLGGQVVAVSPELPDSSLSNAQKLNLEFEVLSDVGNLVARRFGLVFGMPDDLIDVYRQLGTDIEKHNGDDRWELPVPATYIISPRSEIVFASVNANYLERIEPSEVIDVLADRSAS